MKSAWPTVQEITNRLSSGGDTIPSTLSIADLRLAAIDDWEDWTKYRPFLVTGTPTEETRTYHEAHNGHLSFACGFLSSEDIEIAIDDDVLVDGTDYILHRETSDQNGPYTYAELLTGRTRSFNLIEVTGVVGWHTEVPVNVWNAVLGMTCEAAWPAIQSTRAKGMSEISIGGGDLKVKWGSGSNGPYANQTTKARNLANKYRLKTL